MRIPAALRRSVRHKLTAIMLLTTLAALVVTAIALSLYSVADYRERKLADVRTQAEIVARATAPALVFNDPKEAKRYLELLRARPTYEEAALYAADGTVFAAYNREGDLSGIPPRHGEPGPRVAGGYVTFVYPVVEDGQRVGTLYMKSIYEVRRRLIAYMVILAGVMSGALVAAWLVSSWLQRALSAPLLRLVDAARAVIERRDFSVRAGRTTDDEIGVLAEAMNRMLADLEREIAERSAAEEALRIADRRKDEFLATLAHELRNPLAPIRNALYVMRMEGADAKNLAEARAIMDRQVQHMVRLVDDLIDVSRITTGKLVLRRERVDLRKIAEAALEAVEPMVLERGHRLTLRLPEPGVTVDADPTRLAQIFLNLLNNAAKFTDKGGHIDFSLEVRGGEMIGRVSDNGIGISPETMESIFEMFSQADSSLERTTMGLGVGLSLSHRLIELHGGTIEARSAGPGKGSEFTVRMPTRAPEPKQALPLRRVRGLAG